MRTTRESRELSRANAGTVLDILHVLHEKVERVGAEEVADRAGLSVEKVRDIVRYDSAGRTTFRDLLKVAHALGLRLEIRLEAQ